MLATESCLHTKAGVYFYQSIGLVFHLGLFRANADLTCSMGCIAFAVGCFMNMVRESWLSQKWGKLLPWNAGRPGKPLGRLDKLCMLTWHAGAFDEDYPSLRVYLAKIQENPAVHDVFLEARKSWIKQHNENPSGHVNRKLIQNGPKVTATKGSDSRLVDRGREAVFLEVWKEENKWQKDQF